MMLFERTVSADGSIQLLGDGGTVILRTHKESGDCLEHGCCIHNPTMTDVANIENWPYNYRFTRGLMERICPCDVGHPDLDSIRYLRRTSGDRVADTEQVHACCGCCSKNSL